MGAVERLLVKSAHDEPPFLVPTAAAEAAPYLLYVFWMKLFGRNSENFNSDVAGVNFDVQVERGDGDGETDAVFLYA